MKMGNTLGNIGTAVAICASLATPVVWGGRVNEANAVQDIKISTIVERQDKNDQNVELMNKKIDALLWKSGINPNSLN